MSDNKHIFGFVGLGLIGGSIAKAIREKKSDAYIKAYTPHPETVQEAVNDGVVNESVAIPGEGFADCDVIFLCAPVERNVDNMLKIKPFLRPGTILTDVGSTKSDIHDEICKAGLQSQFIGGHPMAGSERIGYRNSRSGLIENAYYILAPEPEFNTQDVEWMKNLVSLIGAIPIVVDANKHDYITAAISHVPHVISASLVNLVKDSDGEDGLMKLIAAGGFKDITRISSSSPVMWEEICMTNSSNIRELLDCYIESLERFKSELDQRDEKSIYHFFDDARQYRDSFNDNLGGPFRRDYRFHVDIEDRPGVLAEVVMYLSIAGINIKNIGITHNREFQEGVLRVECHTAEGLSKAIDLLTQRNYRVYE